MLGTNRHNPLPILSLRPGFRPKLACDPLEAMEPLAEFMCCDRGQKICDRGDLVEHWYRVITGMARTCALLIDGRRQITDFLLPGDFFFGFAAQDEHVFTIEAIVAGSIVARYPRQRVEALANSHAWLGRQLRETAFHQLFRAQAQILKLGQMSATERVGSFLVEMAVRSTNGALDAVDLPMSRYDIADYLALSVETVSRSLTYLKRRGIIVLTGTHQVRIIDRSTLKEGGDRLLSAH